MFDMVLEADQPNKLASHVNKYEAVDEKKGESLSDNNVRHALKRRRPWCYDKQ
jgi:hypothetical protein